MIRTPLIARTLLVAALFCVVACRSQEIAPAGPREERADLAWEPSVRYVYNLVLTTATDVGQADAKLDLKLEGALELIADAESNGTRRFRARVIGGRLRSAASTGEVDLTPLAEELAQPYVFVLDAGRLTALYLPEDASPLVTGFRRTLASAFQFVPGGPAPVWSGKEHDATGEYVAEYAKGPNAGSYSKRKLRYTKLAASIGALSLKAKLTLLPNIVVSKGQLRVEHGVLASIHQSDELKTLVNSSAGVSSKTVLELSLRANEQPSERADFQAVIAKTKRVAADQPSPHPGLSRALDEARMLGVTFEQALAELEKIARLERKRPRQSQNALRDDGTEEETKIRRKSHAFIALTAIFRAKPEALRKAVAKVRAGSVASGGLLDALSASGSEAAQAVLVELARERGLTKELRDRAALSLIRADRPSPATIEALMKFVDDPVLSNYGLYGLGTAARRLRAAGAIELSTRCAHVLVKRLESVKSEPDKIHALRGIANSGYAGALGAVRPYLAHASTAVRAAAIEALRLMEDSSIDPLILEQLERSSESRVQLAALSALKAREPTDALSAGLARFARTTSDPFTRAKALDLMSRWLPKRVELREVVEELAEHDKRPRIRDAARAALGT